MAPSDAKQKNRNIGAQLQAILYTTAPKIFRIIYFLYDLVRTKLYIPRPFWTTEAKFDTVHHRYVATCGENVIQVHIYSLGAKVL